MSQRRILVVEDETIIGMDIQSTLESMGYSVPAIASTGPEAVQLAGDLRPDLVLMDINLKDGTDGVEAAKEIKLRFDLPVVFLTAYSDEETLQRIRVTEPYGYLLKPFEKRELQIVIEIALYKHKTDSALREKTEQVQRSSEEIHDLYNNAPCGYHCLNAEGVFIQINDTELRWLGYSRNEILGKKKFFDLLTPESQEIFHETFPRFKQQGYVRDLEFQMKRKNGTVLPVLLSATAVFDANGAFFRSRSAILEITERKRAEEERARRIELETARKAAEASAKRYSFLAQAGKTLVSSLDFGGVLEKLPNLIVSEVADWCTVDLLKEDGAIHRIAVAHRDPDKKEFAKRLSERYPPPPMDAAYGVAKVIRTGNPELHSVIPTALLEAAARDQEHLEILRSLKLRSLMILPLCVRQKPIGAMSFVTAEDSGRTYTSEDLAFAQELAARASIALENATLFAEAQEAIRLRDEFLSIASHELKTPLTSLSLQLQLVRRRAERAKQVTSQDKSATQPIITIDDLLRAILNGEKQSKRLAELLEQLLDTTRIRLGRLELRTEAVDLVELVREVLTRFESELSQSGVQVSLEAPQSMVGVWDRSRLDQVVNNLVSNALKYGEKRPIEITVSKTDACAALRVRDHGMGIQEREQKRIFERFERAISSNRISGLGLGLYISRQIVEAHGGNIEVQSSPGKGSTFTITLPLNTALPSLDREPEARSR